MLRHEKNDTLTLQFLIAIFRITINALLWTKVIQTSKDLRCSQRKILKNKNASYNKSWAVRDIVICMPRVYDADTRD